MRRFHIFIVLFVLCGWLPAPPPAASQEAPPPVSIALFSQYEPEEITIEGIDTPLNVFAGDVDEPLKRVPAGAPVTITLQRDQLYLGLEDGGIYALSLRITPADEDKTLQITLPNASDPRSYFGTLTLKPDAAAGTALQLINTVDMETYIACVLGGEYGLDDVEGTKAMAVAIRTYALHPRDEAGKDGILSDTRMSQVYRGAKYASERNFMAAAATRGQVLTWNGAMIDATYYSSSGGYTANNEDVWTGTPKAYLRAQPDPYDDVSPYQHWREEIDRGTVLDILSDVVEGEATGFVIEGRNEGGRVAAISVLRNGRSPEVISGAEFRARINRRLGPLKLKSTFFDAQRSGSVYVFEGKGFGHAVGMSQWGAHGMAQQGHSYGKILAFYYPGTEIMQIGDVPAESLVADNTEPAANIPPPAENPSAENSPIENRADENANPSEARQPLDEGAAAAPLPEPTAPASEETKPQHKPTSAEQAPPTVETTRVVASAAADSSQALPVATQDKGPQITWTSRDTHPFPSSSDNEDRRGW